MNYTTEIEWLSDCIEAEHDVIKLANQRIDSLIEKKGEIRKLEIIAQAKIKIGVQY